MTNAAVEELVRAVRPRYRRAARGGRRRASSMNWWPSPGTTAKPPSGGWGHRAGGKGVQDDPLCTPRS